MKPFLDGLLEQEEWLQQTKTVTWASEYCFNTDMIGNLQYPFLTLLKMYNTTKRLKF